MNAQDGAHEAEMDSTLAQHRSEAVNATSGSYEAHSGIAESAWEPYAGGYRCLWGCGQTAKWKVCGHSDDGNVETPACETRGWVCYVCDVHKVEPQPPSYEEWLAL